MNAQMERAKREHIDVNERVEPRSRARALVQGISVVFLTAAGIVVGASCGQEPDVGEAQLADSVFLGDTGTVLGPLPCQTTADCPVGQICDGLSGQCRAGNVGDYGGGTCTTSGDCAPPWVCNAPLGGTGGCYPPTSVYDYCNPGYGRPTNYSDFCECYRSGDANSAACSALGCGGLLGPPLTTPCQCALNPSSAFCNINQLPIPTSDCGPWDPSGNDVTSACWCQRHPLICTTPVPTPLPVLECLNPSTIDWSQVSGIPASCFNGGPSQGGITNIPGISNICNFCNDITTFQVGNCTIKWKIEPKVKCTISPPACKITGCSGSLEIRY